jgi:ferredoxin-nitrite reductase
MLAGRYCAAPDEQDRAHKGGQRRARRPSRVASRGARGWETLDPDDVGRLKWYGLYPHNTNDGHFMLRTKVVQGKLTVEQVETMAGIAEDFGRGVIDCTTRQCFQIHWIRLENIIEIFDRLERAASP